MSLSAPSSPMRSSRSRRLSSAGAAAGERRRISKDEKICQLRSDLKVSKEENMRLRREIERLRNGANNHQNNHNHVRALNSSSGGGSRNSTGGGAPSSSNNAANNNNSEEQRKKFREAMRALKKVTVSQEVVIKSLKTKAKQRRKEIKQKDSQIAALEQRLKSLKTADRVLNRSKGDETLQSKIKELQLALDEALARKNDLEELLDEKEAQMDAVSKQRNSLLTPLHKRNKSSNSLSGEHSDGGSQGSGSQQSVSTALSGSTAQDFDVARLKTELAKKSHKLIKLEMDLEMVRDELDEMKRKRTNGDGFGGNAFFPPTGFTGQKQTPSDDWTDVDESDESEFGESFFSKKDEDSLDFW